MVDTKLKILILAVHYEVTGARYIADAFARLGHDVKHDGRLADLEDYEIGWGVKIDPKYRWVSNVTCTWELTVPIKDWKPDLIIIADTRTVAMIKDVHPYYADIPIVAWSNDNHVRNVRRDGITHYFLAHAHGPAQPVTEADESWLPCASDTTIFTPSQIEWSKREYDIALVGVMYPRRVKLVQMMRDAGLKVFASTGLVYEEYAAAYQNSRISLCVSAARDVAQRVYETAAMGCTILTDLALDLADEDTARKLGLQGFFVYQNDEEAVSIAKDLVTNESAMAQFGALTLQKIVRERHSWEARCRVVVDWYEKEYGSVQMVEAVNQHVDGEPIEYEPGSGILLNPNWKVKPVPKRQNPYLNLGCGTTHFPSAKPAGHDLVPDELYQYPNWVNIDKVEGVGADKTFDLFTYPWPLKDNSYDGAILSHLVEHCPHEIKINPEFEGSERANELLKLQDGWYCLWAELYRVLTLDAKVYVVSPYGFSDGGITDPSHHRYLTMNTFTHSMTPEVSDGSTFKYNNGGINFQIEGNPQYRLTPYAETLKQIYAASNVEVDYNFLMGTHLNVCYDMMVCLKCVK